MFEYVCGYDCMFAGSPVCICYVDEARGQSITIIPQESSSIVCYETRSLMAQNSYSRLDSVMPGYPPVPTLPVMRTVMTI